MPFKKGQSGNPGGRVGVPREVRDLARQHSTTAIERLVHWMKSDDPRASVAACNSILDRGFGRPAQLLDLSIDAVSRCITELSDDEMMALEQRLKRGGRCAKALRRKAGRRNLSSDCFGQFGRSEARATRRN
jgi:hypothetical protein